MEPCSNARTEADHGQARFADRREAGRRLAERLLGERAENPVVVALPRGGVPVAREIASALEAPLEVLAVRKLGAPNNPEYGIGAVAEGGTGVIDAEAVSILGISTKAVDSILARETAELRRRVVAYRGDRPPLDLRDRTVIVVDDGVATGLTDTAALRAVRRQNPRRVILAVPVCAPDSARRLREETDEMICLWTPALLYGVGQWYRDFSQVSDDEVIETLRSFGSAPGGGGEPGPGQRDRRQGEG
jgi:putative phosphoribosyl transferase